MTSVGYLGPEGSFTHQAAAQWATARGVGLLVPAVTADEVVAAVANGDCQYGIVAVESTVEGYVVPSLDALIESPDVVAVDEMTLDISFDAYVRPGHGELTEVTAHPHGLAQCRAFAAGARLRAVPASSNAAACRDITDHQVALGPAICGSLYGLQRYAAAVEDFAGARTRFLALVRRDDAAREAVAPAGAPWRTMLTVTPMIIGPGVLARITSAFGRAGVNLSSLITRPVKAVEGSYLFILTADAAPWEPALAGVLTDLIAAGDRLKTLGVMPRRVELDEAVHRDVEVSHAPIGSVGPGADDDELRRGLLWR